MKVFIGGYTKKTSKGIYQADLTIKDGQASLGTVSYTHLRAHETM